MSILNTKAGDHPHVQVLFPFRMSRKRAWKPKRSLGGPVAHAALSWWPRDRNPERVWAPRTARSCWERVGKKNLGGKSSPPASACPLPGPRMPRRHPWDRDHPEGSTSHPCPTSRSACIPQNPLLSPGSGGSGGIGWVWSRSPHPREFSGAPAPSAPARAELKLRSPHGGQRGRGRGWLPPGVTPTVACGAHPPAQAPALSRAASIRQLSVFRL